MALRPEQERALEYIRRKGTEGPLPELHERVAKTLGDLEALLDGIGEDEARRKPTPDRWCVQEIVDHLVESHRPAVAEIRALLRGERPAGGPIPASLLSTDPMGRSWPDLVQQLKEVHADFLAALATASDESPGEARAPVVLVIKAEEPDGRVVPVEWIGELDWKAYAATLRVHTIEHQGQIERTLATAEIARTPK
jgi:hypothetical protein